MPYYNRDPRRDHSFDNHPLGFLGFTGFRLQRFRVHEFRVRSVGFRTYRVYGFRGLGFMVYRVQSLYGLCALGLGSLGSGFKVLRVQFSGFKVHG